MLESLFAPQIAARLQTQVIILGGEIGRGEPLVERSVAARLGVSRTPVRETIFRLEREGLVRIVEGKGAFVASYTIDDVIEIYHVREGLEPIAARLACSNLSDDELDYFEKRLERYIAEPEGRDGDHAALQALGRDFHNMFIQASRNTRLIKIVEGMHGQIELVRGIGRTISRKASRRSSTDEHLDILRALRARDPDRAEHAARVHLQNGLQYRLDGLGRR